MEYEDCRDEAELCFCSEVDWSERECRSNGEDNTDCTARTGHQPSGYGKNRNLLDAVESGDTERISRLLKLDASPNATCRRNYISACHIAALTNSPSLTLLIKSGAKSFKKDKLGRTPLHFAAWMGNAKQIAVLLGLPEHLQNRITDKLSEKTINEIKKICAEKSHLANISCVTPGQSENSLRFWKGTTNHNCCQKIQKVKQYAAKLPPIEPGWTALHAACARAHVSCVQLLLAAGASPHAPDKEGRTPLDVVGSAFYLGLEVDALSDTVKVLLSSGATFTNDIQEKKKTDTNTPLHTAVELERIEAIKMLLDAGAPATCLNTNGLTAMHICVNKRLRDYLQLLVNYDYSNHDNKDAIVNTKDKDGMTVILSAIRAKWTSGIRIALKAGADLSIQSNDGESPLHIAVAVGDVEILQEMSKCSINAQRKDGWTPLFVATAHNHLEVVKILVTNGASFAITKPFHLNVLHIAAKYGNTEILEFLINCNELCFINEISTCTDDQGTPLFLAVVYNHEKCVSLLLQNGAVADILLPFKDDTYGVIHTTALHVAATKNYIKIVKILSHFDHRLINQRNSVGLQPLHEACLHANRDIISLLINKGADLSGEYSKSKTPIDILMINVSKPTAFMEEMFDYYISSQGMNIQQRECKVTVDYKILLPNDFEGEIKVIKALIDTGNRHNQKRLLQHPLIESFLYLKWKALLPIFYAIMMLYGSFVLSLNLYVMSVFYYSNDTDAENDTGIFVRDSSDIWKYMTYMTSCLITVQIVFMKIKTERSYFLFLETWINVLTTVMSILLPTVVLYYGSDKEWVRLMATIAVLLSWLEMMFLLSRFPKWGFYVLMFGKVTTKVFKVLMTFGFVIIGFSICFMIQFRGKPPFESLWAAVTKTFVMMTSEYDYMSTINNENAININAHLSILRLIFITFVILASMVLMNLMIGVAVNDVNNLEERGNQKRLEKQVDFLMSMEGIPKFICEKLPKIFHQSFLTDDKYIVLSPRLSTCKYYKVLPTHIREAIFEKAQVQKKKTDDELDVENLKWKLNEILNAIARHDKILEKISERMKIKA